MKILHIIDIPWYSAVTAYVLELSKGLAERGHSVYFACTRDSLPLKFARTNGFPTVEICSRRNPFIFNSVLKLKSVIEKEAINVVNVHTGTGHFIAYLTSLICKRKFVTIRTKSDALYPKKSFLYKTTPKIITASEFTRKKYLEIGLEPEKVVTIYQGIDVKIPNSKFQTLPTGRHVPNFRSVGIVGRLDPVKGHKYFLEAASIVIKKFPDVKFLVAGKEENIKYKDLKLLADNLGIRESVDFFGYVANVFEFMSKCSIGVVASTGSEAVSRVLIEWMACSKPVIATSVGCMPEILYEECIITPRDPESMATKIRGLLSNPDTLKRFGERNKKIIMDGFNQEKFISRTEKIYNEAIKNCIDQNR